MKARVLSPWVLVVASLFGAGCFWLEPIQAYPGPDEHLPDGSLPTDGGEVPDGGEVTCDPAALAPSGLTLVGFDPASLELRNDDPQQRSRLSLSAPASEPVWVTLATDDAAVAAPELEGVCFLPGETAMDVAVEIPGGVGPAIVTASLSGASAVGLSVRVRDANEPPVLVNLTPPRRIVAPDEDLALTVLLDRAAPMSTTITLTSPSQHVVVPATVVIPQGELGATFLAEVQPNAPLRTTHEVRAAYGDQVKVAQVRIGGPVISEVRIASEGFVEFHNPTGLPVSLSGWSVQFREFNGRSNYAEHPFAASAAIAPGGYWLVALTSAFPGAFDEQVSGGSGVVSRSSMRVRLRYDGDTMDDVHLGSSGLVLPVSFSQERKAWAGVTSEQMLTGDFASSGNGYDSDNDPEDFFERSVPEPQSQSGGAFEQLQ